MFIAIYSKYSNSDIDPYTIKAYSLEHKQCYNIVIGKRTFTFYNKSAGTFYYVYKIFVS